MPGRRCPKVVREMTVLDVDDDGSDGTIASRADEVTMDPAFSRNVLDVMPAALVVVDDTGSLVYANEAMARLAGIDVDDGLRTNIFDHIHPDDAGWLAEAFVLLASNDVEDESVGRPWAPINFRIRTKTGEIIPVEVTGRNALRTVVDGVIYDIRPAVERDILQRVLSEFSVCDRSSSLDLVVQLVGATALEIESAVLHRDPDGVLRIVGSSTDDLRHAFDRAIADGRLEWAIEPTNEPRFHAVEDIGGELGRELTGQGHRDVWCLGVASPNPSERYGIVALTPVRHVPAIGVMERLTRAAELAAVVLLRSHADELLEYAAHHDDLTGLANRAGLRNRVRSLGDRDDDLAVLFLDLDGFKTVNDRFGHAAGDRVLQIVAERLRSATRPGDVVARLGGDEFAIVLAGSEHSGLHATAVADRVLASFSRPIVVRGNEMLVSASIGLVSVEARAGLLGAVDHADRAMYVAKRAGGGRVHADAIT